MKAKYLILLLGLFAMFLSANPLPSSVEGPFIPGEGGEVAFRSIDSAYTSYAIVNSDIFHVDSVFMTSVLDDYRFYVQFNTGITFTETNSTIDIYNIWSSYSFVDTFLIADIHYGFPIEPPVSYASFSRYPLLWDYPTPPDSFYWRNVMAGDIWPGELHVVFRAQLNNLPVDYDLPNWGTGLDYESFISINEIKPFGTNKFIEIAQYGDTPVCLENWFMLAEGFHFFTEEDTLVDYLVFYDSEWDSGFSLPDTGEVVLFAPDGTAMNSVKWRIWPDASLSANTYFPPPEYFWCPAETLLTPTPGTENAMSISEKPPLPSAVAILSAQPNPFNASASIGYEFAHGVTEAEIGVFDILGREVLSRSLSDTRPGYHET